MILFNDILIKVTKVCQLVCFQCMWEKFIQGQNGGRVLKRCEAAALKLQIFQLKRAIRGSRFPTFIIYTAALIYFIGFCLQSGTSAPFFCVCTCMCVRVCVWSADTQLKFCWFLLPVARKRYSELGGVVLPFSSNVCVTASMRQSVDGVDSLPGWRCGASLSSTVDLLCSVPSSGGCYRSLCLGETLQRLRAWVLHALSGAVEVCRAFACSPLPHFQQTLLSFFSCHIKMETTALLQAASHITLRSLLLSSLLWFCSFALLFRDFDRLFSLLHVKEKLLWSPGFVLKFELDVYEA